MEENYVIAFEEVSKRFSKDEKLFYFYLCALYGLLCKYNDYKGIVIRVFNKCAFYLEDGDMNEILERHNINSSEHDEDYIQDSECNTTYGISNQGHEFYIDSNGGVSHRISNPFIACTTTNVPYEHLLNTFCHEMGHLIKGEVNGSDIEEKPHTIDYYIRTGFAYYSYTYDKVSDELSYSTDFSILDEAINVIQTTDVMREILTLADISNDEGLLKFIGSLDRDELLRDRGYEEIIEIVRKLWENGSFRFIAEKDIVESGIDEALGFFDDMLGEDELYNLNELLEEAFELSDGSENPDNDRRIEELKLKASDMIKRFKEKVKVMVKS